MAFIILNPDLRTRTSGRPRVTKNKATFLRLKTPRNMAISENVWIERKKIIKVTKVKGQFQSIM